MRIVQVLRVKLQSSPPPAPVCRAFKYFVWLNSSVRGPFLPAYHPAGLHWTTAFVRKLRGDVKLVGSTINCGGAYALSAQQPHIQSYAVATDQVRRQDRLVGVAPWRHLWQCSPAGVCCMSWRSWWLHFRA